jgi:hypothetical protein
MQPVTNEEHVLYGSVAKVAQELHSPPSPPSGTHVPPPLLDAPLLEPLLLEPPLLLLVDAPLLLVDAPLLEPLLLEPPLSSPVPASGELLLLLLPHATAATPPDIARSATPASLYKVC